jgi:7-cyano-7-deazaguanine reductase
VKVACGLPHLLLYQLSNPISLMPESDTSTLSLLGRSENRLPSSPQDAKLEFFPNRHKVRDYWIHLDCTEFSSLCPVTGQPDMARIQIRYVPNELCVETKSLKFYMASFRNLPAFNEDIVNRVLTDLVTGCAPRRMVVRGTFGARGGIQLTCQASFPDGADAALGLLPL